MKHKALLVVLTSTFVTKDISHFNFKGGRNKTAEVNIEYVRPLAFFINLTLIN